MTNTRDLFQEKVSHPGCVSGAVEPLRVEGNLCYNGGSSK